jgi:hypothetical protein
LLPGKLAKPPSRVNQKQLSLLDTLDFLKREAFTGEFYAVRSARTLRFIPDIDCRLKSGLSLWSKTVVGHDECG